MRLTARVRSLAADRVNVALFAVFLLGSAFYLWVAAVTIPLSLHGGQASPYNQLADAFIHFHLWVARAPAALLRLPEPYNPQEHLAFIPAYPDYAFYGHYLYLTWGPAPVLVLLVPLHLLGYEPSESVIVAPFAIAGLGFALATLRVLLRQIGKVTLWICVLAALTLTLSSAIPYDVGFPTVYHEAVAGGFCFAMAGIWLAVSAVVDRRASLTRLVLMSLCFGLATGSRPTLGLTALVLVPVYMALRSTRSRRGLLVALAAPVGSCFLLLAAYNQARFGSPLLLFGALAAWLALSAASQGPRRRLIRVGGGLLAAWSCLTGVAIACNEIAEKHTGAWHTLVNVSSPLSTALAAVAGHPVLADVYTPNSFEYSPESYTNISSNVTAFWLGAHDQADLTIVSPDAREAAVAADVFAGPALKAGASLQARIRGPGKLSYRYPLAVGGLEARIPVHLSRGVNRLVLSPVATAVNRANPSAPESRALVAFAHLRLVSHS